MRPWEETGRRSERAVSRGLQRRSGEPQKTPFLALSFYDVFAVRSFARGEVPDRIAAYAGATGIAISNFLGFSSLTGTAVRCRIYASLGLDLSRVTGVIATAWIGFWFGLCVILGVLFFAASCWSVVFASPQPRCRNRHRPLGPCRNGVPVCLAGARSARVFP